MVYGIIYLNKTTNKDKIASKSENAITETSDIIASIENKTKTSYALIKVEVALLKFQIAIEIDKSEQKAEAELNNAINYLSEASLTADEKTKTEIDLLITKLNTAKKSLMHNKDNALKTVSAAIDEAKNMSENFNNDFQAKKDKYIVTFTRKYADLKAEEALLKAKIAAQSEKTYSQAQVYLEEANEWYNSSKEHETQKMKLYKEQIQKDIEVAQSHLKKMDKEARIIITDIIQKASKIVSDFIEEDSSDF